MNKTDNPPVVINLARLGSVAEARKANAAAGHFFFSRDTMRFFDSEVVSDLYAGAIFITSERPPVSMRPGVWGGERRFTLRAALASGGVATVGGFGDYPTKRKAVAAAKWIADGLRGKERLVRENQVLTYSADA